jgi:hypothetical protein
MFRKIFPSLILIISSAFLKAQEPAIGMWRDHLNYSRAISVAAGGGRAYCATRMSLFSYDLKEEEIQRYSKINGLTDMGFQTISYNKKTQSLVIAYSNSNIDILKNGKIYNLPFIRRSNISGDKRIYGITQKENLAYLATGFGIVVLDLTRLEVRATYFFGPEGSPVKTNKAAVSKDSIYAATDQGIFKAALSSPNLADFKFWSKVTDLANPEMPIKTAAVLYDKLFFVKQGAQFNTDSVFYIDNGTVKYFDKGNTFQINSFESENNLLYYTTYFSAEAVDFSGTTVFRAAGYNNGQSAPIEVAVDENGDHWLADKNLGLIYAGKGQFADVIFPNGPAGNSVYKLTPFRNKMWIAPGGRTESWASIFNGEPVSFLENNNWQQISPITPEGTSIFDILQIVPNPTANPQKAYGISWGAGIIEFTDNVVTKSYNHLNSPLDATFDGAGNPRITVSSGAFDKQNNLWLLNTLRAKPLKVLKADGKWAELAIRGIPPERLLGDIIITASGHKWITLPKDGDGGIVVFDDNGTIDDPSDDRSVFLTAQEGRGGLPGKFVYSMAEDVDGKIWVGTENGVGVFYNPNGVFSEGNFDAQQIKLVQDGYVQYLLENEPVSAIAIDGGGRKWFGTEGGGAFLMSPDGTEKILSFNASNSPLLSNTIYTIAIDDNGEVFFGTENGLISYRSDASKGGAKHANVYAFPNPVRSDHEGPIAIRGLVGNADVKITDVNGMLVYATKALGGQAVWDGRTVRGERARSGVYLVFSSNDDGSETMVTKVMILN